MDTSDDRRTVPIPTFRQPRALLDPPPADNPAGLATGTATLPRPTDPTAADVDDPGSLYGPPSPRLETSGTRTATSDSIGDKAGLPTARETAKLIAGLLGIVVAAAAWGFRLRRGAELRRPTRTELDDVSLPLARLAVRHVPAGVLNADLADVLAAGAATGAYLSNGPLTETEYVDPGLPDDLNGDLS